jgi:chromosome segregation ATPase
MSKNKDGQVEVNADGSMSGTDNSRRSGPSGNINNNGIRSTNGSGDDYGHNHGKSKSSGNHHNRGNTAWQSNLTLGPFTEAASEAIQHMSETHKAIRTLSDLYTKHVRDIEEISKIQERCNELETQCGKKDELIKRQKGTIITLKELSRDMEEEFEQNRAEIGKEREDLEAEKKKFDKQKETVEKRAKAQEAEQKSKQDKELEKLKAEQDKHYKILKEKLEQDVKKQEDEIRKRLTDLETDNRTLSEELNAQKEKVEEQQVKLAIAKDDYDDLKRLKNSFKDEKEKLKEQLDMIESEFALNGQTTEF